AAPMVAGFRLLWAGVACSFLAGAHGTGALVPILVPLGIALLLDAALCVLLARREASPHRSVRLTAAGTLAGGALWGVATAMAVSAGPVPALAAAALVAGVAVPVAAYFLIPGLLLASCAATLAGIFLLKGTDPILGIAVAVCAYLVGLGLVRARDLIFAAHQKLAAEGEAKKARRFVADFEASGRGWFWETTGDGCLAYVSEQFARRLGTSAEALVGRRFEDLLVVEALAGADESKATLGFHLNARFPFTDLVVGAEGSDACWSLSGNPVFDAFGRFMGFRGLGTNITEERRREVEVSKRARYDSLTGLPNRATMRNMLDEALANAAARQRGCGLMMIDLDRFKPVNDTLGHPVGDKLLKDVSRRLADTLGPEGRVGRIGGDEFEAILPGFDEEGRLAALAEKLIAEMCRPFEIEGHEIRIGGSIGIAVARPGKAYAESLIKEADLALYAAKADGRGTFRFFSPDMHQQAADRQMLEADLRGALVRDQLRLLYQPIVDSVSEEIVGFEALLRWQHPTRGLLSAAEAVPIAEECGLMPAIGNWVLRTACAEAARWPAHVRIAVNLSPAQLRDSSLPGTVTGALASAGLDPGRLELEITEAVFLADAGPCGAMLDRLNALGVRLALDNFGTGRSGLGHLRSAPFDKIKIDRSFVRGAAAAGGRDAAIVRAIVVLAESLRMDTTAEGA
ncbi:MAG: putative bifunctional diguanylate cyclase/phosphodiesterase, partial [Thermaurantiacus tibetensis]